MAARLFLRMGGAVGALFCLAACAEPAAQSANDPNNSYDGVLAAPLLSARNLLGATPQLLDSAFGPPALRRVDGQAQVWLYHSQVCGLNLILYPGPDGVPRVADAVTDNDDPAGCTASLRRGVADAALEPVPAS